jgi:hypothetical protein
LILNIRLKSRLGVKFIPSFVMLPIVVTVAFEPLDCTSTIFDALCDDPSNETTVAMFIDTLTFFLLIQNLSRQLVVEPA